MNKKEEKKLARITAEMEKHDKTIKESLDKLGEMLKEIKKHGLNCADDYLCASTAISATGVRMMQEILINTRLSAEATMLDTKIVKVKDGDEAKKLIDNIKKEQEEAMSCKDGKKKPSSKKCCGGKKCK